MRRGKEGKSEGRKGGEMVGLKDGDRRKWEGRKEGKKKEEEEWKEE